LTNVVMLVNKNGQVSQNSDTTVNLYLSLKQHLLSQSFVTTLKIAHCNTHDLNLINI